MLFTNSTVSPLATVILLGCHSRRGGESGESSVSRRFRVFGARAETTPREKHLSEPNSREMTRPVRKLTCHGRQAPTVRVGVQIRSRRRVDRPWTDARAAGGRAAGRALTKKPSSPLSPPSLMVAANAGDAMRTVVAPTTAACDGSEQRRETSAFRNGWCFSGQRRTGGAPRSSAEASDATRRRHVVSFGSVRVAFDSVHIGRSVARAPRRRTPDARQISSLAR